MIVSQTVFWCAAIALGSLDIAKAASFIVYLNGSMANTFETPLNESLALLPYLDTSKNTTIYTAGFQNKVNGPAITTMISTYLAIGTNNVVLLNWDKESQGGVNTSIPGVGVVGYPAAVAAARVVASKAGDGLVTLFQNGLSPDLIQGVGHSLGAHLLGWVGERVQERNYNLSSICGLDPAGNGFGGPIGLDGLDPSRARNVFTVITNPGIYGTDKSLGTVNFRVNCGNDGRQPGCPRGIFLPLSDKSLCSHNISWMIFAEALRKLGLFPAARANSCNNWKSPSFSVGVINYLGDDVDFSKPGDFYLSTNPQKPYSKGNAGLRPN